MNESFSYYIHAPHITSLFQGLPPTLISGKQSNSHTLLIFLTSAIWTKQIVHRFSWLYSGQSLARTTLKHLRGHRRDDYDGR